MRVGRNVVEQREGRTEIWAQAAAPPWRAGSHSWQALASHCDRRPVTVSFSGTVPLAMTTEILFF